MTTINYNKVPTKKDLVVELAKIHKIKNYKDKNVVELLFTILDETLEYRSQRERALYSIYGKNIKIDNISNILEIHKDHIKFKDKTNTTQTCIGTIKECDCLYCLSHHSPKSLFTVLPEVGTTKWYDGPQNELVKKK